VPSPPSGIASPAHQPDGPGESVGSRRWVRVFAGPSPQTPVSHTRHRRQCPESRPQLPSPGSEATLKRIAIIGGGIGGLTTAIALLKKGHEVRLLDGWRSDVLGAGSRAGHRRSRTGVHRQPAGAADEQAGRRRRGSDRDREQHPQVRRIQPCPAHPGAGCSALTSLPSGRLPRPGYSLSEDGSLHERSCGHAPSPDQWVKRKSARCSLPSLSRTSSCRQLLAQAFSVFQT
jgi:hypothetical protein